MKPIRNLLDDLVERRLWPVALVLVAALVAVPLLLRSAPPAPDVGGEEEVVASTSAADLLAAPAADPPTVVSASSGRALRGVPRRDPFRQKLPPLPRAATSGPSSSSSSSGPAPAGTGSDGGGGAGSAGAGGGGGSSSSSGSPGGASGSSGSSPGSGPIGPPRRVGPTYTFSTVDVRFGLTDATLLRRDVPRLSALPNADAPVTIFLGLVEGGSTARFVVPADVKVDGDGTCFPSRQDCQTVELKPGGREFFSDLGEDGKVVEYQLDYLRSRIHRTKSRARALAGIAPYRPLPAVSRRTRVRAAAEAPAPASASVLPRLFATEDGSASRLAAGVAQAGALGALLGAEPAPAP